MAKKAHPKIKVNWTWCAHCALPRDYEASDVEAMNVAGELPMDGIHQALIAFQASLQGLNEEVRYV